MKSLKYIIATFALSLGLAISSTFAQDAGRKGGGPRGGDPAGPLLNGISLTADQQTKVDAIKADTQKQMQGLSQEDRRAKGRQIREESVKKIRAVLTADQQPKFDENVKKMQQHGGDRTKGGDKNKGGNKPGKAPKDDSGSAD